MNNTVLKAGLTGVKILAFGLLARHVLSAPRTVGYQPFFFDLFIIIGGAVAAFYAVRAAVEHWVELDKGKNGRLLAAGKGRVRKKLYIVAVFATIAAFIVVCIDHIEVIDRLTPYHLMLLFASFAVSVLAESAKEARDF
jgi:hypothetical protein